jgi:hypothetical protein
MKIVSKAAQGVAISTGQSQQPGTGETTMALMACFLLLGIIELLRMMVILVLEWRHHR